MKKQASGGCLCLGAPIRALSRACDSACDLYVRGMSGCARHVPTGAVAAGGRGGSGSGFGRSATAVHRWTSASSESDLASATSPKQRRAGAAGTEKADAVGAAAKKGTLSQVVPVSAVPARRIKGPALGTIAEDGPCEFGGACALKPREPRRRAEATGEFGAVKTGSEAFARRM
ncbi:uncharacterized protein LOC100834101 [Brachypodium distachyon]|uniref:Uncharacterized protein n=1 Tax=Brachypodium distachyon TaxID=15368 RepID=I1HRZ6_BRADI|nr:uncharacterized protein LOC100834101 [Brachypodium distachyon]KQK09921.1 hypothetical protein BRADI_2g50950v3 [Brachypodium distachyon]|eukprot:XP_003567150.1 uncharacterized protein LOC100834101 [Brachypodium distachyon]